MMKRFRFSPGYLLAFLALTALEVFIALFVRDRFVRPYLGDVMVVWVVYCALRTVLRPHPLFPLWVFLFAAAVEVSQLFHLVELLGLEGNRVMATILGATFDPADLLCYGVGCVLLALWQHMEKRIRGDLWRV